MSSSSSFNHPLSLFISSLLLFIYSVSGTLPPVTPKPTTVTPRPTKITPKPPTVTPRPTTVTPKPTTVTPKPTTVPAKNPRELNRARRNVENVEFLNAHNVARVAAGATSLKWNMGLTRYAAKWAKQRKTDCKMTHSAGPYGENIFWYQRSENWPGNRVVAKWVEERLNYNAASNTCAPGKMCGHYTQIIWRPTTAVGCARTRCDSGRGFLVVCEYSPEGNYEGESPFDMPKV